jgi:alpha-galactosidase
VTYEAEAPGNDLGGTASVDRYPGASGGRIVRNIGAWYGGWYGPRKAGSLRFTGVTAPVTGTYLLSFFYVHLDGEAVRTAVIAVSGSPPVTLSVSGGANCCAVARLRITLRQGANTVTFFNPTGHAPSIDKIVIGPA